MSVKKKKFITDQKIVIFEYIFIYIFEWRLHLFDQKYSKWVNDV